MKDENKKKRIRADELVLKQSLAESITKARALILAGQVAMGDELIQKPGQLLAVDSRLRVRKKFRHDFVARSALKLQAALDHFCYNPTNKVCLDVGASTGGFTQVLLLRGAKKVYALDVGTNQLDWSLRKNEKVISLEQLNIKDATHENITEPIEFCSIDVSFISLKQVIPHVKKFLCPNAVVIALVKPQHEVYKHEVEAGGLVQDDKLHKRVTAEISAYAESIGFRTIGLIESPIRGYTGNKEFLICFQA